MRILRTSEFGAWLTALKDMAGKAIITARIQRLELAHFGDSSSVGDGISELRIHFGPGYRVYFKTTEKTVVLLLCGGHKGSQKRDIAQAKAIAAKLNLSERDLQ